MVKLSAGVFDTPAIRQSCWQTCDYDVGAFTMSIDDIPAYRDKDTISSFQGVATFFGCVDLCEEEYEVQRAILIVPIIIIGKKKEEKMCNCD